MSLNIKRTQRKIFIKKEPVKNTLIFFTGPSAMSHEWQRRLCRKFNMNKSSSVSSLIQRSFYMKETPYVK